MRVLLLEDDVRLLGAYARRLRRAGCRVDDVRTLAAARRALAAASYDCLVLDRLVPDGDALELVAELHTQPEHPPTVVISALSEEHQRIAGLAAGADDYLGKPVHLDELAVRVSNVVETVSRSNRDVQRLGPVVLDRCRREVRVGDDAVHLTARQYMVFEYLASRVGQVVEIEDLLEHCWDRRREVARNPLGSQITRLRAAFRGHLAFEMARGVGYILRVPAERDDAAG